MTMTAKKLTAEEIKNVDARNYNPQEWDKQVSSYLKYGDVQFYIVGKGNGYDYERHFVEYTLPEGLRLFGSFGYGGSITNGGFYRLDKIAVTEDGRTIADMVELMESGKKEEMNALAKQVAETKLFLISYGKFTDANGNQCVYNTTKAARTRMAELSTKYHMTFTKG